MEKLWYKMRSILVELVHFEKRSRANRYLFALLCILVSSVIKSFSYTAFGRAGSFLLSTLAVMLSSWYGGLGPGLFATFIASIFNNVLFLDMEMTRRTYENALLTTIFIIEGVFISLMSEVRYEYERQKDGFVGLVAHELKNPLSSIRGFAQLIALKNRKKREKETVYFAEQIGTQSERMLELINDLLDVRKIEVGKFSYRPEPFEIDALLEEVVAHQQVVARRRKIILLKNHKKVVYGDRYRIGQAITNLLTNALKYSPEESTVVVASETKSGRVIISVSDKGIGIPKEDHDKIFSEFYRTNKAQGGKAEGLGLGLYITSQIIKSHKGKLWVKSKESKGSTFFMELPVRSS